MAMGRCMACMYWCEVRPPRPDGSRECRFNPPQLVLVPGNVAGTMALRPVQPQTEPEYGCGRWRAKLAVMAEA